MKNLENKSASQISGIVHLTYLQKYKLTNNLLNNNVENVEIFSLFQRENKFPIYSKNTQTFNAPLSELINKNEGSPVVYLKSFYNRLARRMLNLSFKSKTKISSDDQKCEMERVYEKNIADNMKMLFENDTLKSSCSDEKVYITKKRKTIKNRFKNLTVNLFTHK